MNQFMLAGSSGLYGKFRNSDEMVIKAFQMTSITEALTNENMEEDDPFSHL